MHPSWSRLFRHHSHSLSLLSVIVCQALTSPPAHSQESKARIVRFGVDACCNKTTDVISFPSLEGHDEPYFIVSELGGGESTRTGKFDVNDRGDRRALIHNFWEREIADGQTVEVVVTMMEADGGVPSSFWDKFKDPNVTVFKKNTTDLGDVSVSVILPVIDLLRLLTVNDDDLLGVVQVTIKNSGGYISMTTKPVSNAKSEQSINANRFFVDGSGASYTVEFWAQQTNNPAISQRASVQYRTHLEGIGDTASVAQPDMCGTTGESRRLEGIEVRPGSGKGPDVSLRYRGHISTRGNTDWVGLGSFLGTRGESLGMEAIWIETTGEFSKEFDVYYSAHLSNYGWTGWCRNGETCGTTGNFRNIEAVKILIADKIR